ncbi:adenosylcobinamide-GDP ribazoletransferase [Sulfitobacter sp. D35]|uniref:adenosylcobinamide-GDP ribazoletransferase n=1 Tax=Sulfitobacter sp. D35 TaxID=3083252 RepID=UPI00296F9A24|nr:adenosylcobinamide-GDP ribazoletransferase [Sulfitobacter sp. D35]MDW4496980.1 adenosylcobinamide-GDP ribazoletransferase [Sulfitobacter sp. D35]
MALVSDIFRSRLDEFRVALSLLSRLPVPAPPPARFRNAARAAWAYPLAGLAVACPAGFVAAILMAVDTGPAIAAGAYIALSILFSGAMHEDGLADCADGFWGGWTVARRLEIMKDSAIGTYGFLSLIVVTGMRWSACALLLPLGIAPLLAAAMLSRAAMPPVMALLPNARDTGLSHGTGRPGAAATVAGLVLALTLALLLTGPIALFAAVSAAIATAALAALARAKIRGQTGDVLGACQQLSELAILLTFATMLT